MKFLFFKQLWLIVAKLTGVFRCYSIKGGLGNQMFQYAFALVHLKKFPTSSMLDISYYARCSDHNGWEVEEVFGLPDKLPKMGAFFSYWFVKLSKRSGMVTNEANSINYDALVMERPVDGLMRGYRPSYRYFEHDAPLIRRNFTFKRAGELEGNPILWEIRSSPSVALHVRRGDYLAEKNAASFAGICTEAYYTKSIALLKDSVPDARFFIFSNDPEWCKTCFIGDEFRIVEGFSGKDSWKDMYLMSQCRHSIIANSSFSWWGMWLGVHEGRIAVAPSLFRNGGLVEIDIGDILPPQVTRISPKGEIVHG